MSSKRKTPARRKTTPAPSEKSIAATSVSPSVVETASPISAPVLVDALSEPAVAKASSSLPAAVAPPAVQPAIVGFPAVKAVVKSEPERAAAPRPAPALPRISHDERHRMIAKVAYGYAEKAGFRNNPVDDWLMAEREVEAMLGLAS